MKKKVVAMMLAAMLAASTLAGCGNGSGGGATDTGAAQDSSAGEAGAQTEGGQAQTDAGESGGAVENFNETGFPIVNEPITLKVMQGIRDVDSLTDPSEMPAIQRLEEETGIKLEWEVVKGADWPTKLNLMFASGEYPDVIITPNTEVDQEEYGVSQQLLIPLNDDLTSKYMPNYTERREAEDSDPCAALAASDGNKYSIGYMVGQYINTSAHFFINQAWLDNLSLETPKNVEELTEVLRQFKAQDANGNGDASDEVPLEMTLNDGYTSVRYMLPMFGVPASPGKWIHLDNDKKVQFTPVQEGFRNCMEWLHTCYEEELLDPEVISQDSNTADTKLKEDLSGFFTVWRLKAMGYDDGVAKTCTLYTPQDEGVCMYRSIEKAKPGVFLTATNQYVPQTLRLIDAMMETETMYSLYYGEKDATDGTGWEYNDEGKVRTLMMGDIDIKNFLDCNAPFFGPGKYIDSVFEWPEQRVEKTQYCQIYDDAGILQTYSNDYIDMAPLTSEQLQANALVETDIDNAVKENMATFITDGVTDESWNAFVSLFDGMNVADYVSVYQTAIDSMEME